MAKRRVTVDSNDYTDIRLIIDVSSSMRHRAAEMSVGINEFVDSQKNLGGKCKVSLYEFGSYRQVIFENKLVDDVPKYNMRVYGMTALNDGICQSINDTNKYITKMGKHRRPNKVIYLIVTDGGENNSVQFNKSDVIRFIAQETEKDREFVFIGHNFDGEKTAESFGVKRGKAITTSGSGRGVRNSFEMVSSQVASYRSMSQDNYVEQVAEGNFFTQLDKETVG